MTFKRGDEVARERFIHQDLSHHITTRKQRNRNSVTHTILQIAISRHCFCAGASKSRRARERFINHDVWHRMITSMNERKKQFNMKNTHITRCKQRRRGHTCETAAVEAPVTIQVDSGKRGPSTSPCTFHAAGSMASHHVDRRERQFNAKTSHTNHAA